MERRGASKAAAMATAVMVAGAVIALSGCTRITQKFERQTEFVEPERPNDSCDSARFRPFLGKSSDALAGVRIPEPYRILLPDGVATTDYNPARLNLVLGADGTLTDLTCG